MCHFGIRKEAAYGTPPAENGKREIYVVVFCIETDRKSVYNRGIFFGGFMAYVKGGDTSFFSQET